MLNINKKQMEVLDLICFQRQCRAFVTQELELLDYHVSDQELKLLFDQFSSLVDMKNHYARLSLIMLLVASLAFKDIFTQQAISRFMGESMTPEIRCSRLQYALLQHANYDAEFLHRKSWI